MTRFARPALLALIVATVAVPLLAQQESAPPSSGRARSSSAAASQGPSLPMYPVSYVLGIAAVTEQLNLSEQQLASIQKIQTQFVQESTEDYASLQGLPPEQQQTRGEELQRKAVRRGEAMQQQIESVLSSQQLQRARQIAFQMSVPGAVMSPQISQNIQITEQQQQQLEGIRQQAQQKILAIQYEMSGQVYQVLTPEQRSQLQQMMAPPAVHKPAASKAAAPAK